MSGVKQWSFRSAVGCALGSLAAVVFFWVFPFATAGRVLGSVLDKVSTFLSDLIDVVGSTVLHQAPVVFSVLGFLALFSACCCHQAATAEVSGRVKHWLGKFALYSWGSLLFAGLIWCWVSLNESILPDLANGSLVRVNERVALRLDPQAGIADMCRVEMMAITRPVRVQGSSLSDAGSVKLRMCESSGVVRRSLAEVNWKELGKRRSLGSSMPWEATFVPAHNMVVFRLEVSSQDTCRALVKQLDAPWKERLRVNGKGGGEERCVSTGNVVEVTYSPLDAPRLAKFLGGPAFPPSRGQRL